MNIPEFSVKHSILGNMLFLVVLVGGIFAVSNMNREVFPEVELDLVIISTCYPNASPEEVEDLVTSPLEDEIRDVDDIEEYTSSSVEGLSLITVEIDPEAASRDRVINDIQRKVDQVKTLPDEADDPIVESITTDGPVINLCISGSVPEKTLRDYGDYMKTRFEEIPGVSTVTKQGWRDEEFWIEVDPAVLEEQEISLLEINEALARQNVDLPGGKIPFGAQEIILRTKGKFHNTDEIEKVVIRSNSDGNNVTVGDVAHVRRTYEEDVTFTRINGDRTVVLGPKKKSSGDTITIVDEIRRIVDEEKLRAPEGVSLELVNDEAYYVKRRLDVLMSNALIGMAMVLICLLVFLNIRVAIITAIGIPFSFLAALLLMSVSGVSINMMTMFGLIIVLGMVVDDAIIVGENVFRHIEDGAGIRDAAIKGTTEVMFPVVSTVLTTIAAFFPIMFAPDIYGKFLKWIPIVVIMTLGASLFEALLVMPSHVADFVRPMKKRRHGEAEKAVGHKWMKHVTRGYAAILTTCLRGRYIFLILVLLVFASSLGLAKRHMRVDIFPADLIDIFYVRLTAPMGAAMEETEKLTAEVEKRIAELPDSELENVVSYVGWHTDIHGVAGRNTHYSTLFVYLTPQDKRERKTQTIIDAMRENCAGIDGIERLEFEMVKPGPPAGKALEIKIRGTDLTVLKEIAGKIEAFLENQEGVADIRDDFEQGKEEIQISIDEQEAARLGLDVRRIAQTVYTAFRGLEATVVREGKEELKVRVRLQEPERSQIESLEQLVVPNSTGRLIKLSKVAQFKRASGLPAVSHHDGDRIIAVTASINSELTTSAAVNATVGRAFENIPQDYPGYQLLESGEWKETRKVVIFMIQAFVVALLLIYTILAVQFNSFLQPFVVMVAIPLGITGVILALILHDKPISMMALMGMIGLTGVVVNDAIVLVTFINDQRRNGMQTFEALVDAGRKRLRPILLTSVTTVSGLMPVIFGWGGYEPFIAPAAIALAYGLICATVLTLLVVPAIYFVAVDMKRLVGRVMRWVLPRRAGVESAL